MSELQRYFRIDHDGSYLIVPPCDLDENVVGFDSAFTVSTVYMTEDEYKALPEHGGW